MMDRLISLGVGTSGDDDFNQTYQDFSELARSLGVSHDYVSMTAQTVGDDEESDDDASEELYHDENTLSKVRSAMMSVLISHYGSSPIANNAVITDLINEMQTAGILFRERKPS